MAVHEVTFPIRDEAEILELRAGDEVIVQGHIIGIRDRTQIRIFDEGFEPPMDLTGAFLLHTAPNVRKVGPGKYEKLCIGTTTSARMMRFTEPLGRSYGVRAICGKGGFPDEAIEPMAKHGMVYFALVGGAAALDSLRPSGAAVWLPIASRNRPSGERAALEASIRNQRTSVPVATSQKRTTASWPIEATPLPSWVNPSGQCPPMSAGNRTP